MWPELTSEWEIDARTNDLFDQREGITCWICGSNLRSQQLAESITFEVGSRRLNSDCKSLASLCHNPKFLALRIAEINACGSLHQFWTHAPNLAYSEYGSKKFNVRNEDLMKLSYPDESFDLVLTSETLEHVPDIHQACAEIARVLVVGGMHIFTLPVVWGRSTRKRAEIRDGQLVHILPPSYHGTPSGNASDFLVFYEFGDDVVQLLSRPNLEVRCETNRENPTLNTFIAVKQTSFNESRGLWNERDS